MRYRHIVTGIEFTTSCIISGNDFVEVKPAKEVKEKSEVKESKPKTTTTKRAKK